MDEERIKKLVRELIVEIGEDPTREGLTKTPERVADTYKEIFSGYDSNSELSVQFSEDSETVVVRDIQFYSMCEHHMLPFYGKIMLAYSPNGRVFGISKLVRLVEKHSKRLQIQERMTKNIADELFLTGTAAHVTAVGSLDNRKIGNGDVGPITKQIQELYFECVTGKNPKYINWCIATNKGK